MSSLETVLKPHQIRRDADSLLQYGRDWTRQFDPQPTAIVWPESTRDVQALVQWARQTKTALVPSGGRTGLSGAAVATRQEVVVSLERMNQILEFNPIDRTVHCQAGVITEALQNYVRDQGYLFPVDFAARGSSHIGGNIATNAGGIKVVRYGCMRDWVAGLTVVTGTGEILHLNQGLVKNATGYDLRHLFIGSEGTLGFITEALLKFTDAPGEQKVVLLAVPDLDAIMKIFKKFRDTLTLSAFEFFADAALNLVTQHKGLTSPFSTTAPYYVLAEVDIAKGEDSLLESFEECVNNGWILDGLLSQSETQAKDFWRFREDISESAAPHTPYKNDISVSIAQVPAFLMDVDRVLKSRYPDFTVVWFGHIGDGNVHINILKPTTMSREDFVKKCEQVNTELFEIVHKYKGSISAEHGVGLLKKPYLGYTRSAQEISLLKGIKTVFDPDNLINPGKIF